jgi:ElaB/YqjD/DUF883 family membrane-anchored ribosome-binding protein
MNKKFRDAIDRSLEELKVIQDKVDDFIDDLPDDTKDIKHTARNALSQINTLLSKAMQQAGDKADEAQLQAHLGLMEAQDKLEASRAVVDDYIARTSEESKKLLDEVELKQHLAMMEARDFWETRGSKLAEEFKESAATMQSVAEKALGEMQTAFERWNEQFKSGKK